MTTAVYKLVVTTGDMENAGTWDNIYVTLIGSEGQSGRTELHSLGCDFSRGKTGTYTVKNGSSLGNLLLIKIEKEPFLLFPEVEWYCSKIVVTTPEEQVILFPCYRWISRGELVELRAGKATKVYEDNHPLLTDHRKNELLHKKNEYEWTVFHEGIPHINQDSDPSVLPAEIRLNQPKSRTTEMKYDNILVALEFTIRGLYGSNEKWKTFDEMRKIFWNKGTPMSDYVIKHWKEDDFYGSQFLNGINPNVIKSCSKFPPNFPVTNEMVKPFLANGTTLDREMEKGNIFICDYKKMKGIPTRIIDGKPLFVASGFCLFYVNPQSKLLPIAIQLQQEPSEENPIFLPSDSESDWLLAKMFIKNADFIEHQTVHHLMNTHLLAEVYTVATYRNLPLVHPIYKLLMQHFRSTIQTNIGARVSLLGPKGILRTSSLEYEGLMELMKRSLSEMTYSSLCLPDNITERGLGSVPNFYYRDDGLRLWSIMNGFVRAMVEYYYPSDDDVLKDTELQEWIKEIFIHGFMGNMASGFPESFNSVEELVRFVTVALFTVTGQHAAVNNGQFDYHYWLPNGSVILTTPPPTAKGQSSLTTVLEALPNVGDTVNLVGEGWVLSQKYTDMFPMGTHPEEHFDEPVPIQFLRDLQAELSYLSDTITQRNSHLEVPYVYMKPAQIKK